MCAPKTTKMKAGYKVVCRAGSTTLAECTIDGKKEMYLVSEGVDSYYAESERGDRYAVRIVPGQESCECEGFKRGFRCRHIRLVDTMQFQGDV